MAALRPVAWLITVAVAQPQTPSYRWTPRYVPGGETDHTVHRFQTRGVGFVTEYPRERSGEERYRDPYRPNRGQARKQMATILAASMRGVACATTADHHRHHPADINLTRDVIRELGRQPPNQMDTGLGNGGRPRGEVDTDYDMAGPTAESVPDYGGAPSDSGSGREFEETRPLPVRIAGNTCKTSRLNRPVRAAQLNSIRRNERIRYYGDQRSKELFVYLLSSVRQGANMHSSIYQEMSRLAEKPR